MVSMTGDLFAAVKDGDAERVARLVREYPALARARNADGLSVVLFARYRFRLDIVETLLSARPELDVFEAAALGRTEWVEELLAQAPDLVRSYSPDGFTALQLASFFGRAEAAQALVEHGADVNAVSRNPFTVMPLHSAVAGRHYAICELLLAHGAEANAAQQGGFTPLHEAAQHGDRRLVDLLLAYGADTRLRKDDGQTPTATAAAHGHADIAALLAAAVS